MIAFRRSFAEVWNLLINKMHVPRLFSNQTKQIKAISIMSNVVFFTLYAIFPSQLHGPSLPPTLLRPLPVL
jgi:hypothetical protein